MTSLTDDHLMGKNCSQMAPLEWASTVIGLGNVRENKVDKFREEKEEGAKLAQWLIDCQNDEDGKDGDHL